MLCRKKILFVLLLFISIFGYVVFSDAVNTHYTDFYFVSGTNTYKTIVVDLTGGETGNVSFYLDNKSTTDFTVNMDFVDGGYTTDGSNIRICKSENETSEFGNYVIMDTPSFVLPAGNNVTEQLDLLFPSWYSGMYYGCVIYYPNITEGSTSLNTVARKAIFLDVNISPTAKPFGIKVWPSDRSSSSNKGNVGKLMFYAANDSGVVLYSGYLTTNTNGTGSFLEVIPDGSYDVVYKGQGHLASYLDNIYITGGQDLTLDFTTGANLYGTKQYSDSMDDGYRYQIAGDLRNTIGVYDGKINVNDITMMVTDECEYNAGSVDQYQKCNLNGDGRVNMADIGVIITNIGREGLFLQGKEEFDGFSW